MRAKLLLKGIFHNKIRTKFKNAYNQQLILYPFNNFFKKNVQFINYLTVHFT